MQRRALSVTDDGQTVRKVQGEAQTEGERPVPHGAEAVDERRILRVVVSVLRLFCPDPRRRATVGRSTAWSPVALRLLFWSR